MQAPRESVLRRLKIARGQLDGILRMVEEDRYCVDISNQLMAAIAALKAVNRDVLAAHLDHCVRSSIDSEDKHDRETKLDEIAQLIDKLTK